MKWDFLVRTFSPVALGERATEFAYKRVSQDGVQNTLRYRVCPQQERESPGGAWFRVGTKTRPTSSSGEHAGRRAGGMHEGLGQVHRKALERVEKARWSWEC